MVMNSMRKGASGGIMKIFLFSFLVLAVGGLVLMDVGGFFRGGVPQGDVATAGNQSISLPVFDSSVRRTLQRIGITPDEAYRFGYIQQILNSEIQARLLQQSAFDYGIYIDEERVSKQVKTIVQPLVEPGQNPRNVLRQILMNQGMNEAEFIRSIRQDMANSLLNDAIAAGFETNLAALEKDLFKANNESRSISYIEFLDKEVEGIAAPDQEALQTYYTSVKEQYAIPERRTVSILKINAQTVRDSLEISDQQIENYYNNNLDAYFNLETFVYEQALVDSKEEAQKIVTKIENGQSLEQAVQAVTGSDTAYLGEKSEAADRILEEIRADLISASEPGAIIGPTQTPLGVTIAVFKLRKPGGIKPFEDVKDDIREELVESLLIEEMFALANTMDDLFAGGATVEEAQEQIQFEVIDLPPFDQSGLGENGQDALTAWEDSRQIILETGFELLEGETSAAFETTNGDLIAIHVKTHTPKSYPEIESMRAELETAWIEKEQARANMDRARTALAKIGKGELGLKALAEKHGKTIKKTLNLKATDSLPAGFTPSSVLNIFEAPLNEPFLMSLAEGHAIAMVTDVQWPETPATEDETYTEFQENLRGELEQAGSIMYLESLREKYGASINQNLLTQTYGTQTAF